MPYEISSGLGVYNHYGPRGADGVAGHVKTEGVLNEFMTDVGVEGGIVYDFLPPCATQPSKWIVEVDTTLMDGTATAVTIGGVDITDATLTDPVEIDQDNDGVVEVTGATGRLLVRFKHYPPL